MNSFNKQIKWIVILVATVFLATNILLYTVNFNSDKNRQHVVDVNRIVEELKNKKADEIDLKEYPSIVKIHMLSSDNQKSFYQNTDYDYIIRNIDDILYRFDYIKEDYRKHYIVFLNVSLLVMTVIFFIYILMIRYRILKPFNDILDLPFELAKGNLSVPIKENKNRYFGRFIWGIDVLRETLEEQKASELNLQKEKKTLILSLSHDINTPLSAIKLYSKALSKNLYDTKEKQLEIAQNIDKKADEIEAFVSEIITASNEDFLKLTVENDEFYLKQYLEEIKTYYEEKLDLLRICFVISDFNNCILSGDLIRSVEVLQNIIENAVKYGDGKYINIDANTEENCMIITVKNSGCNLSKNEITYIFDSFWRGSNVGIVKGSGLGLYICKQLMTKMNGDVFAKIVDDEMQVSLVFKKS